MVAKSVLFVAFSPYGSDGDGLWVSDGTADGTRLVKHLDLTISSPAIQSTTLANGKALLVLSDEESGRELWVSDGTANGTTLLKDVNPGSAGSGPRVLATLPNGLTLFRAGDAAGDGLWATDGTSANTVKISDLLFGDAYHVPDQGNESAVILGGKAVVLIGSRLISTDGTANGTTVLVNDTGEGTNLTPLGDGTATFLSGGKIWFTDGTAANTEAVADIHAAGRFVGIAGSGMGSFLELDGPRSYSVQAKNGQDIFATETYRDTLRPDPNNASALALDHRDVYLDLWATDGTAAGTTLLRETLQGSYTQPQVQYDPYLLDQPSPQLTVVNPNQVVFVASDGPAETAVSGTELWTTDGTAAGTKLLDDLSPGLMPTAARDQNGQLKFGLPDVASSSSPSGLTALGDGRVTFSAWTIDPALGSSSSDGVNGSTFYSTANEPWVTDGTVAGTTILSDAYTLGGASSLGEVGSYVSVIGVALPSGTANPVVPGVGALFAGYLGGYDLWATAGTTATTQRISAAQPEFDHGFAVISAPSLAPIVPPMVMPVTSPPTADAGQAVVIASVSGSGSAIVQLLSDAAGPGAGSVSVGQDGLIRYTPGRILADAPDTVSFRVIDTTTFASTDAQATVLLHYVPNVDPGETGIVVDPTMTYDGSVNNEFVLKGADAAQATINGGPGSSLTITGGGKVTLGAGITNVTAVRLIGGDGVPAYDLTANDIAGLTIFTSTGADTIRTGRNGGIVVLKSATATVRGGSGNDTVYATADAAGATLDGGGGHNTLVVTGGGDVTMGTRWTNFAELRVDGGGQGTHVDASNAPGLTIYGNGGGGDTITLGSADQTVYTYGDTTVFAHGAAAAAKVVALNGSTNLFITGGGTAALNGDDSHGLQVKLEQATTLDMGTGAFITATAFTAGSAIAAHQVNQTLVSLSGGDTLTGFDGGADVFAGSLGGLQGDSITNFRGDDVIHATDLDPATATVRYDTSGAVPVLAIADGVRSAQISMPGSHLIDGDFHVASDGGSGALISYGGQYVAGGSTPANLVAGTWKADTVNGNTNGGDLTISGGGTVALGATDARFVRLTATAGTPGYYFTANDTPGLTIATTTGGDHVQAGAGGDTIIVNGLSATVNGGTGNDTFYVDPITIGAALSGGGGHDTLVVNGPGLAQMGPSVTGFADVKLEGAVKGGEGIEFFANADPNLSIYSSQGNDNIHVGSAGQTVYSFVNSTIVTAGADDAGVRIVSLGGPTSLVITTGGTANLNPNDSHGVTALLVVPSLTLNMGSSGYLSAFAEVVGDTIVAQQAHQTLGSTAGSSNLVGYAGFGDTFRGTAAGLAGDTIGNFGGDDTIDVQDLDPATATATYAPADRTLRIGDGTTFTTVLLAQPNAGGFAAGGFHTASDGQGGTLVSYGAYFVNGGTAPAAVRGETGTGNLTISGGGTVKIDSTVTDLRTVRLADAPGHYDVSANTNVGLTIFTSTKADVVHAGDASQTIYAMGQGTTVAATAATAGILVQTAGAGTATLRIDGGGAATLNDGDSHGLTARITAATTLDLGHAAFITAIAETPGTTITASSPKQTMVSLSGGDTLIGSTGRNMYADTFQGTMTGLDGDTIVNFGKSDVIDVTDLAPGSGVTYVQGSAAQGTLGLGSHHLTLAGSFDPAKFHVAADGTGGSQITYSG